MDQELKQKLDRVKELLAVSRHAAMATVNEDGSPHNTPFFFMHSPKLEYVYWASHPESLHSLNVLRTGQIFVVLYDAKERGGLYIKAEQGHILEGEELETAFKILNQKAPEKETEGSSKYTGNNPQRMWGAKVTKLWINGSIKDEKGNFIKDSKIEITNSDLF